MLLAPFYPVLTNQDRRQHTQPKNGPDDPFRLLLDDGLLRPERVCPSARGAQADPAGCLMGETEMIQEQDDEG